MSGTPRAAADDIVAAFGAHDTERYFSLFAPSATFLFHSSGRLLGSRTEYEAEWASWEADGFRVLGCTSRDQRVDEVADGVAVFTHRVGTRIQDSGGVHDLDERETIVLRRQGDGRWLGVHEHLSVTPEGA
jgi:ketosteroid isomerase-like protein